MVFKGEISVVVDVDLTDYDVVYFGFAFAEGDLVIVLVNYNASRAQIVDFNGFAPKRGLDVGCLCHLIILVLTI